MTERSKREIDSWVDQQLTETDTSDVDLSSEEARVVRKHDMIQQGMKPDDSLTSEERGTLRRVATRSSED